MKPYQYAKLFLIIMLIIASTANSIEILQRCKTNGQAYKFSSGNNPDKFLVMANGTNGVTKFPPYTASNFCEAFTDTSRNHHFPTHGSAYDVMVIQEPILTEPILFIADGDSGLLALMTDSGMEWAIQKRYPIPGKAKSLAFANNSILVAGDSGLFVFSLPCTVGAPCWLPGGELSLAFSEKLYCHYAEDVAVSDFSGPQPVYAYVITEYGDIVFCRIAPPARVEYIIVTGYDTCAISIKNGIAYTASDGLFSGFNILFSYAITDPPAYRREYSIFDRYLFGGHGEDIFLFNNYAYLAVKSLFDSYGFNGVLVYDISNPANPLFVDSCRTPGIAAGVSVDSSHIYLADGDSGIVVMSNSFSSSTRHPSPKSIDSHISSLRHERNKYSMLFKFSTKSNAFVSLKILSINGKVCRGLIESRYGAGEHAISWDYSDNRNKSVTAGVYYAVLTVDGSIISVPVIKY